MPVLDNGLTKKIWDHIFGTATFSAITSPVKLQLETATGSDSAAGTEVTGGSYVAQNLAMSAATASTRNVTNSGTVSFTGMPACTVTGIDTKDSAGSPLRLVYGNLGTAGSPVTKVVVAGDTISFAPSSITAAFG